MSSSLRERLGLPEPTPDTARARSSSAETRPVALTREGHLGFAVSVARRLVAAGLPLRKAHAAMNELADRGRTVCEIPVDADLAALAADLAEWNVGVHPRRDVADPAALITSVRARHGLSQRAFADALGLDVRTLQNWEQGRNRPDPAALSLVLLYDRAPDLVAEVVFSPTPKLA